VVKDGVVKGGIFDAQTGNPWCHKDCSRFHPTEVQKMVSYHYLLDLCAESLHMANIIWAI